MNNKEYLKLYNENQEKMRLKELERARANRQIEKSINENMMYIDNIMKSHNNKKDSYYKFSNDVKESLLSECMLYLMKESSNIGRIEYSGDTLSKNLVNKYIKENGVNTILNQFKGKSLLLSEMYRIVNEYHSIIMEKVDKNDTCTMFIRDEDKNDFFDELKSDDADETALAIKERVANALDEFINSNIKQNMILKDLMEKTKEKIDDAKDESLKEHFNIQSKAKAKEIRTKNIRLFEFLVQKLTKEVMVNENLSKIYTKDSNIDMEHIIEECTTIYAFLEMLNTSKMVNGDVKFINEVIRNIG